MLSGVGVGWRMLVAQPERTAAARTIATLHRPADGPASARQPWLPKRRKEGRCWLTRRAPSAKLYHPEEQGRAVPLEPDDRDSPASTTAGILGEPALADTRQAETNGEERAHLHLPVVLRHWKPDRRGLITRVNRIATGPMKIRNSVGKRNATMANDILTGIWLASSSARMMRL